MDQKYFEKEYTLISTAQMMAMGTGSEELMGILGDHKVALVKAWLDWGVPTATKGIYAQRRMKVLKKIMDKNTDLKSDASHKLRQVREQGDKPNTLYNHMGRDDWEAHRKIEQEKLDAKHGEGNVTLGLTRGEVLSL
tara:strand:- start:23 stop:433 length:411 start_codon:yes stop_codon:yes gene_type:complete